MLAQTSQDAPFTSLIFLLGGLLIAVVIVLALLRVLRRRLFVSHRQTTSPAPSPDPWEESARRMPAPPAHPEDPSA